MKQKLATITLGVVFASLSFPCCAQQPSIELLKAATAKQSLADSLEGRTIVVDGAQSGPANTLYVQAHDAANPSVVMALLCSTDVGQSDCDRLRGENGEPTGGKYRATRLPANHPLAYKHYITWKLEQVYEQSAGPALRYVRVYAVYKIADSFGNTVTGHYPEGPSTTSVFAERGRNIDIEQFIAQPQDKTDEQAICLEFVERSTELTAYIMTNNMPTPKVDCYDHLTYTHVYLTHPASGDRPVRGIIMHDNRPGSCGSGGCAISLFIQGCRGYPGDEGENCKNSWTEGIATLGTDMQLISANHRGWYDVVVTGRSYLATTSGVQRSTYRYLGESTYKDVAEIAKEEKRAADEAKRRRTVALSLGLHSWQTQAHVKTILAAHGYHSVSKVEESGPWNCASNGWSGGQWNTSCISQKGDITIKLIFELGKMYRNANTGTLQQVRTDRLIYAQFQFAQYEFPDNTLSLVSPTLKKCDGENDRNGVCLNF
jgi:hypothetical protein